MPVFLISIVAAFVLAWLGGLLLNYQHDPIYEEHAVSSVRIGDPGENLVGGNWSGLNKGGQSPGAAQSTADRE